MSKPFLLLSTRAEDEAVAGEREAVLRFSGLAPHELVQHRLEAAALPPLDLGEYSGILLGGGPFNSSDETKSWVQLRVEADLAVVVRQVVAADFPFLGLCYGVGALTAPLGGLVDRTFGESVGVAQITLTEEGLADPLFADVPRQFMAWVSHKEACTRLPAGAVLLAAGAACPVQAFRVGGRVYATQFHPDLDPAGMVSRIDIYRDAGYFPREETENLMGMASRAAISAQVHYIVRNFVALATR